MAVNPDKNIVERSLVARLIGKIKRIALDISDDVSAEETRATAAEAAAKTVVTAGENCSVTKTTASDGHDVYTINADGKPQVQSDWNQADNSTVDYIKNKPDLGLKADKVQGATAGSLAALDASGNLTDSGKKAADFKTVQTAVTDPSADGSGLEFIDSITQNANGEIAPHKKTVQDGTTSHKGVVQLEDSFASTSTTTAATPNAVKSAYDLAATAVQGVKVNGTELSKDSDNKVDVTVPTASTATPLKDGTASAGSSTQWARGDHRHPTDDSREAVANKVQSIDDESTTEYPSSKAVADFVNSSVATNTATFLGNFKLPDLGLTYPATEVQIASALNSHAWPTGYPTNNDYVYVEIQNPQSTIDDKVQRYKYRDRLASWGYEYTLNNSSFTAEEKAAIDSGITSQDVTNLRSDHTTLASHAADTSNPHQVTAAQVGAEPAFAVLPVSKGGTGKDNEKAALNKLTSQMTHYDTQPTDNTLLVQKFETPTDSNGALYTRPYSYLWAYIKSKISSVLGLSESNGAKTYSGNAATATTASDYASGGGIADALAGKSSTSHTHSVKINGITKTIPATGGTAVDLGTYITSHQDISGKLDKTGNASDTTSTFTKAGGDTSLMTSGGKLSAIFTAISSFFASVVSALGDKVDKESGKGLSTNDFTTTLKNKLDGIAAGAEVNQNAFSYVKVGSTSISARYKKDTLELVAGTGIALTPDANNDKLTIAAPGEMFIGTYGSTPYNTWFTEYSAGKQLVCRVGPVLNGYTFYYLDMLGQQGTDPITFSRIVSNSSVTNGTQRISTVVCNTDNSYAIIGNDVSGTAGTYTDMIAGAARELYNTSGTKTVAASIDGFSVVDTNGSKSIVIKDGSVSASHGFTGNLVGNASTATGANVLIDNKDDTKTVAATLTVQTTQSSYLAIFVNNVIARLAVSNFRAAYAERDGSGNAIASYYLPKENIVLSASGAIQYNTRIGTTSGNQTLSGIGSSVSVTQNSKVMLDVTINNAGDTNAVLLMEVMAGSTSLSARIFFANVSQTVAIPYGVIYTGSSSATLTVRWSVQSGSFIGSFYTRWQVVKP